MNQDFDQWPDPQHWEPNDDLSGRSGRSTGTAEDEESDVWELSDDSETIPDDGFAEDDSIDDDLADDAPGDRDEADVSLDRNHLARLAGAPVEPEPADPDVLDPDATESEEVDPEVDAAKAAELAELEAEFAEMSEATEPADQNRPLHKNALVQAGLVVGATALVFGGAGFILTSMGNVRPPTMSNESTEESAEAFLEEEVTDPEAEDIGQLKTEVALGKQEAALKRINEAAEQQRQRRVRRTEPTAPTATESAPRPAVTPSRSTPVVRAPRPVRSAPVAARPVSRPTVRPPSRAAVATPPQRNPWEAWAIAASAGSAAASGMPTPGLSSTPQALTQSNAQERKVNPEPGKANTAGTHTAATPTEPSILTAAEARVLDGRAMQTILIGTTVPAEVTTPLVWGSGDDESAQGSRGVIALTEPLLDASRQPALPAGTQLVVELRDVDEGNGMAQLDAVAAGIGGTEIPLPAGAIAIRSNGGEPLLAEQYGDPGGEIAAMDAGLAIFGGIARAAEILNRPDEETFISSSGFGSSSSRSSRSGERNVLAAALQGSFETLREVVGDRQEAAITEILSRPQVWYIAGDRDALVLVENGFSL